MEKFFVGGTWPFCRARYLFGVAVCVSAGLLVIEDPLLRRASLLDVGRMKPGICVGDLRVTLPMVLRRGKGGFDIGCISARCVICV